MKKIAAALLTVLILCLPSFPVNGGLDISAKACVLMCADNGEIILSRSENERMGMATLTKIMTAVVAIEKLDPETKVTVPPEVCGIEGSSVWLCAGETLTVRQLLCAVLLESANDASAALAVAASGSVEAFCSEMNVRAASLGLCDTHFVNPHGLDAEEHYSTARDLAVLTRYALTLPLFKEIVSTRAASIPYKGENGLRSLVNHNRMLGAYSGCIGVKTGYTKKCGRCLVTAAERNGISLIAVTLNDPNDWRDHQAMLDYGFDSLFLRDLVVEGEALDIHVVSGSADSIKCTAEPTSIVMSADAGDVECITELKRFYFAPISAGETVGTLVFRYEGREIARARVYACESVEAIRYKRTFFEKIRGLFR